MHRRRRVGGVEELLAKRIGRARPGEPLVKQHRTVGNRLVQLLQRRIAMLSPLVRMPRPHGRDPLTLGYRLPMLGQHLLDFSDGRRVLEKRRVIAGAKPQFQSMKMGFDDARHDRTPAKIDHLRIRGDRCGPRRITHGCKAAVADGHRADDRASRVHGVNASIDEHQVLGGSACWRRTLGSLRGEHDDIGRQD